MQPVFFAKRSGESLLDGKQPQIVLAVRAVTMAGVPLSNVQPAVSSAFCVATRRVKGAMKVDIPSMDQEVSFRGPIFVLTGPEMVDLACVLFHAFVQHDTMP
jgi:hypothetical protein